MTQLSRPVLIALVAAVAFAAVWFLTLRPGHGGSSSPAVSAPGVTGLQNAVGKAQGAVAASQANARRLQSAGAADAGPSSGSPASGSGTAAGRVHIRSGAVHGHGAPARVARALAHHRVVAVLFYNPSSSADRAVRTELNHAQTGRAVVAAAPLGQLSRFHALTARVAVFESPTLVIVDRRGDATTLTGFADRSEISQRIADASSRR